MTYLQRCYNALLYAYEACVRQFSYIPQQNKLVRKYFRDGIEGEIPHVVDVIRNISASLINSHNFIEYSPQMPGQIDITGSHIKQKENLPIDLMVNIFESNFLFFEKF
jgi:antitoxin component HigA of HigAB toxin-antitoxin module